MEFFKITTHFDFLGKRWIPIGLSIVLTILTVVSLATRGLNFGLDFTGGTLVELEYAAPVEVADVRQALASAGRSDALVQYFGNTRQIMARFPGREGEDSATLSNTVIEALRAPYGEHQADSPPGQIQRCQTAGKPDVTDCHVQVQRVEFVGPQVGAELAEKGGLALLYTLIGILIYVMFRFEWRFAFGAIIATAHDVFLTIGFFSATQMEFSLTVLAAILAVLGYSLNDTVVVFDRIRENFRKMRKSSVIEVMNASINETLSRTIMTSGTTMLTVVALFFFGGEIMRGFAVALIVGIVAGTLSSIYIATPSVLALGITREDMLPVKKEETRLDDMP
jgi:preprotein translocase subunit SecF